MSNVVTPFSLKDAPALIERLLPVQKLSAEAYKEQMAVQGKTLTALGSYWKGRKPLILNKACVLGCLLPATDNPTRDLEIFEKLMAMDDESFVARWPRRPKPRKKSSRPFPLPASLITSPSTPRAFLSSAPVDWSNPELDNVKVDWREDISELERRRLEVQMLPRTPYRERVETAKRPEEVMDTVHDHIWEAVNAHIGTSAIRSRNWSSNLALCDSAIVRAWLIPSADLVRFRLRQRASVATSMPRTSTRLHACLPGAHSTSSAVHLKAGMSWNASSRNW